MRSLRIVALGYSDRLLVFYERGGGSELELFAARGNIATFDAMKFRLVGDMSAGGLQVGEGEVWYANSFNDSSWRLGAGGVGYEASTGDYPSYFSINVLDEMYKEIGSCYIRIPFTVTKAGFANLALKVRYDDGLPVAGQYTGSLNNAGERLALVDAVGKVILDFRYEDNWFDITDGMGFSLTVRDAKTADPNGFGGKSAWRPSARVGGTPGRDDAGDVPDLGAVVINELLASSQGSGPDRIELHNTTDRRIDLGCWFLSDDADNLMKYEIAAGTSIRAGGYIVFYEDEHGRAVLALRMQAKDALRKQFDMSNWAPCLEAMLGVKSYTTTERTDQTSDAFKKLNVSEMNGLSMIRYVRGYHYVRWNSNTSGKRGTRATAQA